MAQNIMTVAHKGTGGRKEGWVGRGGWWAKAILDTMELREVATWSLNHNTRKCRYLVAVMDI